MVLLRNTISSARSGGRRQFTEIREKILVEIERSEDQSLLQNQAERLGFSIKNLENTQAFILEPNENILEVLQSAAEADEDVNQASDAIEEIQKALRNASEEVESSIPVRRATLELRSAFERLSGVASTSFGITFADFGPENLRLSPFEMTTIPTEEATDEERTLEDLYRNLEIPAAHEIERGDQCVVAIFDTAYAPDLIDESRIVGEYHGDDVDSVYESQEGHGTMCAGAATANSDDGVPFDGVAPDADVVLVRTTDSDGQIRSDYISEAWNWLVSQDFGKPVVANHSYGTPLCSGRPRHNFCNDPVAGIIKEVNSDPSITSVYAAGNEAGYCGHRPSGLTNGITGHNSLEDIITVGALRYDLADAQRYSSHGRGDCSPISDPKPNVSFALPDYTYYGGEEGVVVKDMSGRFGGSNGGTSHASPSTAGLVALLQSRSMKVNGEPLTTTQVKSLLTQNAEPPRRTQINSFGITGPEGFDARFGFGQPDPVETLEAI